MLDSGLRFAFAFLPAGVAIVVGLVLAVQRRRVLPAVSTPAIGGLALLLVAVLLSASTVVVLPALLSSGSTPETVYTASSLIGILTALLNVLGWVLLLMALFRRLPATAPTAVSAPTPAAGTPAPPAPAAPAWQQPPGDDAPTGRHALLDERGQQVVAQEGVRLSPRATAIGGGAAAAGVAGGLAASGEGDSDHAGHAEEMPTEAVPIIGHPRTTTGSDAAVAGDAVPGDAAPDDEAVPVAEDGPAGVAEAAVGGVPTGASTEAEGPAAESAPAAGSASAAGSAPGSTGVPTAGSAGAGSGPGHGALAGAAGIAGAAGAAGLTGAAAVAGSGAADAAVGGTPAGHDPEETRDPTRAGSGPAGRAADDDAATETLHRPGATAPGPTPAVTEQASEPGAAGVDEAAVGGTPAVAADPPPDPSPVSVDEGALGGVPTHAADEPGEGSDAHDPSRHAAADDDLPAGDSSVRAPDAARSDRQAGATAQSAAPGDDLFRPASAAPTGPTAESAGASPTAPGATRPGGPSHAAPAATSAGGPAAVPAGTPTTPPGNGLGTPRPDTGEIASTVSRAAGTPVAEEGVGGTPTSASETSEAPASEAPASGSEAGEPDPAERSGVVNRAKAQVAGWFEPVTGSGDGGFDRPEEAREEPPSNGHHQGG
ncbi:hypothetical protein LQ327_19415 [Actinomycetospora endophytica]|uniref:Uncharacterized protein n=1 Tax=Actinomycetospora endophytica TaxID=2291215 RepID=A0ABS8PBB1_9PSEU|nr:hypothetical protein [Actinomycetospora endophytica]MCD2195542.1 hypothetical protein [Actinomycetospora endophytica]